MNIVIPVNRRRLPIVFLFCLSLTTFIAFTNFTSTIDHLVFNGLFNWIFIIIPLLATIVSLQQYLKTRFDKNANLVISSEGIVDNLSIFSCGKISWEDISGYEIAEVYKIRLLVVKLRDNEKYLKGRDIVTRYILRRYIRKFRGPIIISERQVDYNFQDLVDIFRNKLQ
jgi:hypothetical protein